MRRKGFPVEIQAKIGTGHQSALLLNNIVGTAKSGPQTKPPLHILCER